MTVSGWLFDAYPTQTGVTVWIIDADGCMHKAQYRFAPSFYAVLTPREEETIRRALEKLPCRILPEKARKKELYSGADISLTEIQVSDPLKFQSVVYTVARFVKFYQLYNADVKAAQMFFYTTQLFPLAFGDFTIVDGWLAAWELFDAYDADRYTVPELSIMKLTPSMTLLAPKYQRSLELTITVEDRTATVVQDSPLELLERVNDYLDRYDPDVVLTEYGDAALLPMLCSLSAEFKYPLHLNRDTSMGLVSTKAMSYFSYGQIKHREGIVALSGRWHLDRENSFIMGEGDMEGLFELSRLSQIGVQQQARTSIGSALSSMQLSWAYRNNVLIPYKRPLKEAFKSFATLLKSDRGGLHFMPRIGFHEQVAELDFASMYPSLMHNHNISPETIDCLCCPDSTHRVPELGYRLCEKRIGLVPDTLRPILKKRARYKILKKSAPTEELRQKYDRIQSALKWILVTCFGYLGFKKSRMGRIEAHEAVNAYSRYALLAAKSIAESRGFELVHAIIDCVWLKKEGATHAEYEALADEIEREVGVKISLEGIYNWILFPASKMDEDIPTATRYVGTYDTGEMKVRGIEVRRRDTPKYVKHAQQAMLDVLKQARTMKEFEYLVPEALDAAKAFVDALYRGTASPYDLIIKRHISKDPFEYENRSINAIVSQTLVEAGVKLSPGESIEYIITDASGKRDPRKASPLALYALDDGYDADKYADFVIEAVETMLEPLGYSKEKIRILWGLVKPRKAARKFIVAEPQAQLSLF
ncbi:MAG TPA: DNA polymerase domain-containing protein [Bacteroidota bacterium]|nr:DNA polymerase domain-containing protein [Bacteroidota bacterium]